MHISSYIIYCIHIHGFCLLRSEEWSYSDASAIRFAHPLHPYLFWPHSHTACFRPRGCMGEAWPQRGNGQRPWSTHAIPRGRKVEITRLNEWNGSLSGIPWYMFKKQRKTQTIICIKKMAFMEHLYCPQETPAFQRLVAICICPTP